MGLESRRWIFSNQLRCPLDNHDRCYQPRYLAVVSLPRNPEQVFIIAINRLPMAIVSDFEDIDQQRNEDEIARAQKADENPCGK